MAGGVGSGRASGAPGQPVSVEVLPNGVTLAVDSSPAPGSVALGVFVPVGSQDERDRAQWGWAHLLEHMVFKGAGPWDVDGVAAVMDDLGGEVNAFTTREYTCFYAKVLEPLGCRAADLLWTLVTAPRLEAGELAKERAVVLEEMAEARDDIEDVTEQRYMEALWADDALRHDILGAPGAIRRVSAAALRGFWETAYSQAPPVCVVAGSGAAEVARRWREALQRPRYRGPRRTAGGWRPAPREVVKRQAAEQVHVLMGREGPALTGADYWEQLVLSLVLGGQNTSRLWLRLREQEGLAYTVGAALNSYGGWGETDIALTVRPDNLARAVAVAGEEVRRLAGEGPTEAEVGRAVTALTSNLVFGLETPDGRMQRLGRWLLLERLPPDLAAVTARLAQVTPAAVQAAARRTWLDPGRLAVALVGPVPRGAPAARSWWGSDGRPSPTT
ncbi:Insulinase family protein [Candidatus Hydrogenisulfobacillus filiaventi]|uniref:Insulinase family protein n=1 Tax=Candidatus Hydrogenisulfobacillus filiaventi TaxID=2707344 RepID=A0A6F8ZH43_9FIRM|nr:pitrilysin family protein [Bacillota bacterium]CAB1129033.1 Insulinase family protein [Candidatus Hydrogenisulfobacillus filiaventi]